MCYGAEAAWVPYVIAAVGAGVSARNQHVAAKKQDKQLAIGIEKQGSRQKEATQRLGKTLTQEEQSNGGAERGTANAQFMDQLRRVAASQRGEQGAVAGASGRFATENATSASEVGDYGSQLAGLFSRVDAPAQQRTNEAVRTGRATSDIGTIQANAAGDDFISRLRASAVRPNPWVDMAAKFAQNVGINTAGSGGNTALPASAFGGTTVLDPTIAERLQRMRFANQGFV